MKLIKQGAEAKLWKDNDILIKERIKKNYRIDEIDKRLRKSRTRKEARLLQKANMINVPNVISVNEDEMKINMEFLHGKLVKDVFDDLQKKVRNDLCMDMGKQISELHKNNLIHGDLTTSNMIIDRDKLFFFDFGLGFESRRIEDKAVDLHLLRKAFESKHHKYAEEAFSFVLKGYDDKEVIDRINKVSGRGRYK